MASDLVQRPGSRRCSNQQLEGECEPFHGGAARGVRADQSPRAVQHHGCQVPLRRHLQAVPSIQARPPHSAGAGSDSGCDAEDGVAHPMDTTSENAGVDVLTKSDITKGNGALLHLLKHACLRIDKEENELLKRQRDANARSRSRSSSNRPLKSEEEVEEYFFCILQNIVWPTQNCGS